MRSLRQSMTQFTLFAATTLLVTTAAVIEARPQSETNADCTNGFVEITSAAPACAFALTKEGAFTQEGRTLADPLVASYEDEGDSYKPIAAGKVVLFPASPSGRFRVVEACEGSDEDALCWTVFVFDREAPRLHDTFAGHYGPERWQSWSPDERHVVLVDNDEGAWWLHVINPKNGKARDFPDLSSNENWTVRPETLAWMGPRSFTVTVKTCRHCRATKKEIRF